MVVVIQWCYPMWNILSVLLHTKRSCGWLCQAGILGRRKHPNRRFILLFGFCADPAAKSTAVEGSSLWDNPEKPEASLFAISGGACSWRSFKSGVPSFLIVFARWRFEASGPVPLPLEKTLGLVWLLSPSRSERRLFARSKNAAPVLYARGDAGDTGDQAAVGEEVCDRARDGLTLVERAQRLLCCRGFSVASDRALPTEERFRDTVRLLWDDGLVCAAGDWDVETFSYRKLGEYPSWKATKMPEMAMRFLIYSSVSIIVVVDGIPLSSKCVCGPFVATGICANSEPGGVIISDGIGYRSEISIDERYKVAMTGWRREAGFIMLKVNFRCCSADDISDFPWPLCDRRRVNCRLGTHLATVRLPFSSLETNSYAPFGRGDASHTGPWLRHSSVVFSEFASRFFGWQMAATTSLVAQLSSSLMSSSFPFCKGVEL